jgi:hypothetical protein
MKCDWMFGVINDLAEFANSNGLEELSELLVSTNDNAKKIVEAERLRNQDMPQLFVVSSSDIQPRPASNAKSGSTANRNPNAPSLPSSSS